MCASEIIEAGSLRGRCLRSVTNDKRDSWLQQQIQVGPSQVGGAEMDRLLARCSSAASAAQAPMV